MSYSAKDFTGVRTNRSIKYGLRGYMGNRTGAVKQYKKSENKWKKELKSLKKQNKMLYSIANKSLSRREIKDIRANGSNDISNSSSDYLDSDSSLTSDSS